jgi:hypothetical protein
VIRLWNFAQPGSHFNPESLTASHFAEAFTSKP